MKTHTKLITTGLLVTLSMNLSAYNHAENQSKTLDGVPKQIKQKITDVLPMPQVSLINLSNFAIKTNQATWSETKAIYQAYKADKQIAKAENTIAPSQNTAIQKVAKPKTELTFRQVVVTEDDGIVTQTVTKTVPTSMLDGLSVDESNMAKATGIRLQALLDWHNASPGPIDGQWGENTVKALKAYQAMIGVEQTGELTDEIWQSLLHGYKTKPILVNYHITHADMQMKIANIPGSVAQKSQQSGMYYESMAEALAERFHMHIDLFKSLNGNTFKAGDVITVYNINRPNLKSIDHLVANKSAETLYAYSKNKLVAMYPASYGSVREPSPSGTHKIVVRVHEPKYTYTSDSGKQYLLPPGPNGPVGNVWLGLSKDGYGIHGSPLPERISRQTSAGCVRLTNWDALALYSVVKKGATIEFR